MEEEMIEESTSEEEIAPIGIIDAFQKIFETVPGVKTPEMKGLAKAPKTIVEVDFSFAGFYTHVKCPTQVITDHLDTMLADIAGEKISNRILKFLVGKVDSAVKKFQAALDNMVEKGLTSISVGYSNDKIPLMNVILGFKVDFTSKKASSDDSDSSDE